MIEFVNKELEVPLGSWLSRSRSSVRPGYAQAFLTGYVSIAAGHFPRTGRLTGRKLDLRILFE